MGLGKTDDEHPYADEDGFTLKVQADNSAVPSNLASPFSWIQIIQSDSMQKLTENIAGPRTCTSSVESPALDGSYPTAVDQVYKDAPQVPLYASDGEAKVQMKFKLYLLWDPLLPAGCTPSQGEDNSCSSIPVPLGNLDWDWSACSINTKQTTSNGTTYVLQCGNGHGQASSFTPSRSYPNWQRAVPIGQPAGQAYNCTP